MANAKRAKRKSSTQRKLVASTGKKVRLRSVAQILRAERELYDKRWYDRHQVVSERVKEGKTAFPAWAWEQSCRDAERIEKEYGKKNLGPYTDFEWGKLHGKHVALRWVLGDKWDNGDT